MGPVKAIKKLLLTTPLVIENRLKAIDQLLFVNGNGYEWRDGELCGSGVEVESIHDAVIAILNRQLLQDTNNMLDMYRRCGNEHIYFKQIVKQVEDIFNVDSRMKDMSEPEKDFKFYTLCRYSKICNIPDDVTPEWLDLIEEVIEFMKEQPHLLDDPENLFPGVVDNFHRIKNESAKRITNTI